MTSKRNCAAMFSHKQAPCCKAPGHHARMFSPYAGYYSTNSARQSPNTHNNVVFLFSVQKLQKPIFGFWVFPLKKRAVFWLCSHTLCVCKRNIMRLQTRNQKEYTKVLVLLNFGWKETASKTTKVHNLHQKTAKSAYCRPFMVRAMRFLAVSTLKTLTRTMSPTFKTSRGCLMNLSLICEICTRPS